MLSQVVLTNNKILKDYFENVLKDGSVITANWGFPVTTVIIEKPSELDNIIVEIAFDMLTDDYQLKTKGIHKVALEVVKDEEPKFKEEPGWVTVDSKIIKFFTDRIKEISEQFFTTRELTKEEKALQEAAKETEKVDKKA